MAQTGVQARRSAVYLLDQVIGEGRLLSECIASGALERLQPAERATAQRLALDTLRGMERADRMLQKHLQKYPPLTVRNALRVATVELCQGGAAHGVVNSAVSVVGANKRTASMKGLVNAVLRKVAAAGPEAWDALRVPRLPKWLREPLVMAYGGDVVQEIEKAHFAGAPLDLTAKHDRGALHRSLGGELLESGSVRLEDSGQVSTMPGFKKGSWWVQDAAAALPVQVLAPKEDEAVLELCAAPGGKTMQLAAAGAKVRAVDSNKNRMERVRENLKRTKLEAELVVGDAMEESGQWDTILLDAPCSATGTIRRHPDLPFAKDGSEFGELIHLQSMMLDHALDLLKPGGRLVYCTCSLLPDEGEVQVEDALARHKTIKADIEALKLPGIDPAWITEEGGLRLRPDYWADKGGMDGFYIACLVKA
ncbi:RsmB/NOP family class I SAM-dependent RNA methyltransferase [Cognatishimia activa]|uniref:Ribosomal RNA small subunit methyltransferase B n=1 Tax=Cognatishimia activa TaxID=1715691 RepID=A0A0N7MB42_9RHOB|nr:transcription antitermination factor NusB [Cognatishimia activa]CUI55297.1 Ribosomal RNA small subunit methyltransferase B [Cognatishimia activa]CUK24360.1 Ribosomal RNA small subunit methyltransferase B [Cognatishimia activa]